MKRFLALKASAGSGKTFALTVRYITLLLLGARPKEILTLTFTNKAANEMSERIYNTLLNLGEDEAYLNEIAKQSNLTKEKILEKKEILVDMYTNATLSIFTIDKFINMILREFCGYIGISDDFEIKEDDSEALSIKFLESLSLEAFDKLVDFQIYEKKKYSSLFDIFQNLLEKNEDIETVNIDASLITLQKQTILDEAYKIKEFILNSPQASDAAKNAVDFNSFEELLAKGKTWLSKDSAAEFRTFKKCSNELLESFFTKVKSELKIYYKIRAGYSISRLFELFKLFKEYKLKYNISKNYLHFSDISNLTYELLSKKIDKEFLYFRLDSKFSHILIDEFQDTSLLQYKILQPLIEEILSAGGFKSFFYVGDTKQSIYRFRGGKRELFDYVLKSNPQVEVEILNTNYRSCENIVNFVNNSFNKLSSYEYYDQMSVHKSGFIEVLEDSALLEEEKYVNIAKKVSSLMQKGVNSNDIAILTYTNDDVLSIYSYLKKMFPSLKISTEMTSKLINQENVKALINMVKFLYFKEDLYKENVNAILGKEPSSSLEILIDIKRGTTQELLYKIANVLNITDENVIKLIELSNKYKNIVEFVYEIDKLEASIENSEQRGLQILTIFKSKGLEFHTVLLIDRIKQKNADRGSLLFEYDNVELKNIYYKISGLENYNEEYKKALEKERALAYEDELNILYVALTRAKKNMVVFKKEHKNSVFNLLDLNVQQIGEVVKSENKTINYEKSEKVIYKPLNLGVQEKPVSKEDDDKEYSLYSRYFGIATHYCLEMMNEFNEKSLNNAINLTKNRFSSFLKNSDFESIKKRVTKLLENGKFQDIVKNATFNKEQSLLYNGELKIIDLLAIKENSYYIFDYKTTKDELDEHQIQVKQYKKAIEEIEECKNVYTYIIYLKDEKAVLKEII
ncbi:RecB-like helicase [Halarcobacter anaerophilus]|uniref:DNA 3'-5' helicase n=2 Tax=Halarcobacter anaerophilus TaxID=877500 RepID=A0A4Q0XW30_9BACT|nr:RecB-like helicase [Halarcobacter anaerophilus]QDF27961.1 AddAB recombination complex, helicase AddA [Halarcobacter anaerophilus]RXJ61797.1 recombinase RecB [Halarcobacter anaerophilus]